MNQFCQDRDLLALEPGVFRGGGFITQQLAAGTDGAISGTTFTSAASNFVAAGVAADMVVTIFSAAASEGSAFEIVSVDSPTQLTVSVLRPEASGPAIAPTVGGANFHVRTFGPQIQAVSRTLAIRSSKIDANGARRIFARSASIS
jgi:hypothetical protein